MKIYLKRFIIFLILTCFSIPLYGCWDYTEMHDITYVAGMTIDKDKTTNEYILTSEALKSSPDNQSMKSVMVESRGKTIHAAFRDSIKKTGNQLQLAHMKVIIVSKDIAKEGIVPVLDLINRDVEVRNDMWVAVSGMDTASKIFTEMKDAEGILSYNMAGAIGKANNIGKYVSTEVINLIDDISSKGTSGAVPMIKVAKKEGTPSFEVYGAGMFNEDKMVGELSEDEVLFLKLLNPKEKKMKYVIPIQIGKGEGVSFELMDVKQKIKPKVEGDKISMDINIDMDVALSELNEVGIDFIAKKGRDELKKYSEKYIRDTQYKVLEKIQKEYKSDILGLGTILNKKDPSKWKEVEKNWDEIYADMKINLVVKINMRFSGLTNKAIGVGE